MGYIRNVKKALTLGLLFVLCLWTQQCVAQFDAQFNEYWYNRSIENPAAVGEAQMMQVSLIQRNQWVGIRRAPITTLLSANVSFRQQKGDTYHGVGFLVTSDVLGLFANQYVTAQYAYKFKLGKGYFSAGIGLGLVNVICNADSVRYVQSEYHSANDPAVPIGKGTGIDFDGYLGIWYSTSVWYVGLSGGHIPKVNLKLGEIARFNIVPLYTLSGGYDIKLRRPNYKIELHTQIRSDFRAWDIQATALLSYKDKYWGGVSGKRSGLGFVFGTNFFKGLTLGYTYELPLGGGIIRHTMGSHEIYIGYEFSIMGDKGDKSYKSVRYL